MKRHSQRGVALVVTLILLSVITFMAVTFLVISRHEGAQVDTLTQQSNAKQGAEAAYQQAMAQIAAQMFASGGGSLNMPMLVSTTLANPAYGGTTNLNDVSYYDNVGNLLTGIVMQSNLNNLLILPRPPVFVLTNKNAASQYDFRFWLDLNRNGIFDDTGLVKETNADNTPTILFGTNVLSLRMGDPQWVGVLNHPEFRHSSSNFFVSRYCFLALPIGNSLDINYIHNHAKQSVGNPALNEGFFRNQGVGSWEINLAGFLNSLITNRLSTNYWAYSYNLDTNFTSGGVTGPGGRDAFSDAFSILNYRYGGNYSTTLPSFHSLYSFVPNAADSWVTNSGVDGYTAGPLLGTNLFNTNTESALIGGWPGANSTNLYLTVQDIFNHVPTLASNHLVWPGQSPATDERYAFYRMLSQLSVGSAPESAPYPYTLIANTNFMSAYGNAPKMNLNFCNAHGLVTTNYVSWTPSDFFTNAADRMLRAYFPTNILVAGTPQFICITNIPIYPVSYYTPSVQRILQLAANMYDASVNNATNVAPHNFDFPDVFRPTFNTRIIGGVTNVFISGYTNVVTKVPLLNPVNDFLAQPLSLPEDLAAVTTSTVNIYGVPWIIGVKKGFPNFNQFSMNSVSLLTRGVQLTRPTITTPNSNLLATIQYSFNISNLFGFSLWNSYSTNISRPIDIYAFDTLSTYLCATNDGSNILTILTNWTTNLFAPASGLTAIQFATNQWGSLAFKIPLVTSNIFIPSLYYHPKLSPLLNTTASFDVTPTGYFQPHFLLNMTNRLRFIMVDELSGRVIDYVHLNFNDGTLNRDLTGELAGNPTATHPQIGGDGGLWDTNRVNNADPTSPIKGVNQQIAISLGNTNFGTAYDAFTVADWQNDQLNPGSRNQGVGGFSNFYYHAQATNIQLPFTPTRYVTVSSSWQANDPLVHYTLADLTPLNPNYIRVTNYPLLIVPATMTNLGTINQRYYPWNDFRSPNATANTDPFVANSVGKDPMIQGSDDWQFPANKYPNIGWLGRVHRGTPWQTVYLKSGIAALNNWTNWTGNTYKSFGASDGLITHPTNDWLLMDLFTTAPNDNASRGQLSVNQSGVASWAAILDGVEVVSNTATGLVTNTIDPSQVFPPSPAAPTTNIIQFFADSIYNVRTNKPFNGTFTSVGQILAVPQLTVASPYINTNANLGVLRDEVYERIPQQIMGLLRLGTPRYAIFAYGQSLKPSGVAQSGQYFGMPTNYSITGEMATRTIVRFENFPIPGAGGSPVRPVIESFTVLPPE